MLSSHAVSGTLINAVELYGDPCWLQPARELPGLGPVRRDCGISGWAASREGNAYPLVSPTGSHFAVQSLCSRRRPQSADRAGRPTRSAGRLSPPPCAAWTSARTCPIPSGASAGDGADFLAEHAFQPVGGTG